MLIKAKLQLFKKQLFDFVQELQKKDKAGRKLIYEQILKLDKQIDVDKDLVIQIKDKSIRTNLMEDFVECKKQVSGVYASTKRDAYESLDNVTLAQLNDAAYKAIRKTGNQKRLDERALKNQEMFKKLDIQLEQALVKIKPDSLEANPEIKKISDTIGTCPVSLSTTIECLKAKDCMCIGLEISRSEATINDPSRLIIREVLPSFISLDSFLESSIYNLKLN